MPISARKLQTKYNFKSKSNRKPTVYGCFCYKFFVTNFMIKLYIAKPPSTVIIWPVTNFALSLRINSTISATSCTVPMRPSGVSSARDCKSSSLKQLSISVFITPGQTAFTRIPLGASSCASALLNAFIPPLVAE